MTSARASEPATKTCQGTTLSAFHKDTRLALRNVPDDSGFRVAGCDYCLEQFVSARGRACDKKSGRRLRIDGQLPLPVRSAGGKTATGLVDNQVAARCALYDA